MHNEQAYLLLKQTMEDARSLPMHYFADCEQDISLLDGGLRLHLKDAQQHYKNLQEIVQTLPFGTILSLRDSLMVTYVLFRGDQERDFYSVGPFRLLPLEEKDLAMLQKENHLSTAAGEALRAILQAVPCNIMRVEGFAIARNILLSFYNVEDPTVQERDLRQDEKNHQLDAIPREDINIRAQQVAAIYKHEAKLMGFLSEGNYLKALGEARFFTHNDMQNVMGNSCISHRSYLYAANTCFRKAAESVGIHPIYLDEISRKYAQKLALCVTHEQLDTVYMEMVEEYCRLCREYPTRKYSQNIQRVMNYVKFNLSQDLSPDNIAEAVNFSPSYISRKFKEEVGISLMNYVTAQRIEVAKRVLRESPMSVGEISAYVGIPDWNYFTKLFKKAEGCTPTEYRRRIQDT